MAIIVRNKSTIYQLNDSLTLLQTNINNEAALRAQHDGDLSALTTTVKTDLVSAINELDFDLGVEVADRQSAITTEAGLRSAADTVLTNDLADEVARATAAEGVLTSDLADEVARATAAEGVLTADLATEEAARIAGDNQLSADLGTLQTYVDTTVNSAITTLTSDLSDETAARMAADAQEVLDRDAAILVETNARIAAVNDLTDMIDFVKENVDPAAIDSLTEIIDAFQTADSDLNGAITALAASASSALTAEVTRATAAETALAADLAAEATLARANESTLTTAIAAEATRATAAEATLTTDLASEVTRATAAEGVLTADLATEVARATAAEGVLTADLATEVAARIAAITAEEVARDAAILVETNARIAAVSAEEAARIAADGTLTANLAQEVIDRKAGAAVPVLETVVVAADDKIVLTAAPQQGVAGIMNFATVRYIDSTGVAYDAPVLAKDLTDATGKTFVLSLDIADQWLGFNVQVQYVKAAA